MSYNKARRGRGNFWDTRPINPLVQLKESPFPPLGRLIEAIDAKALEDIDGDECTHFGIKDVKPIASYNWVDQKAPKIIVPGMHTLLCSMVGAKCLNPTSHRSSGSLETTDRSSKASRR